MGLVLYFAFLIAFKSLGTAVATSRALDVTNNDPVVRGGALHECYRTCKPNDTRVCYYEVVLFEWTTLSRQCGNCPYTKSDCYNRGCLTAGGDIRTVKVANLMLPGPSIQVCYGDIVQVNVTNALSAEATAVHWHGMSQLDTPYMDGVPFLTQCPILPGNSFLYNFTADPAGTHMWHSHSGFQETDGFHGSLIIREANDVNAQYYDYDLPEHIIIAWHWFNQSTAAATRSALYQEKVAYGYGITINGYSAKAKFHANGTTYYTPRATFTVSKGYRYRFRVISNAGIYCPFQISVDDHTLNMITTDGASFAPVEVDTFICNAGERYDFVLTANQSVANYWIRIRGLGNCATTAVNTAAILHYEGASDSEPSEEISWDNANRAGVLLNPAEEGSLDYSNNTLIRTADLENTMTGKDVQNVSGTPDYTYYMSISMNTYSNYQVPGPYGQFDNISFSLPPVPLLTQGNQITSDMYCTPDSVGAESCTDDYCTCPYLYDIPKGKLIEIFLIDTSTSAFDDHPIHLHGHYFRIVAVQPGNASETLTVEKVRWLNEAGLIPKNLDTAPLKDDAGVPGRGFIVLRLYTSNPGYWLFHCHVAAHFEEGMGVVLKVGNFSEMVRAPAGFPTCSGNYDILESS